MRRTAVSALLAAGLLGFAGTLPGQERITAWPLVYHVSDAQQAETDILWPLLRYERNETYRRYAFRPFVFSTESDPAKGFRKTSVLWPLSLYERKPGEHWLHVFPVYWDAAGADYAWLHVWPLFGVYHRGASFTQYSTLWPLFTYGVDTAAGDLRVDAPWPLIRYERAGERRGHRVLPLYAFERWPDRTRGFVLPYFWDQGPDSTLRGLAPLWYSYDAPGRQTDLVLPLYFHDRQPGEDLRFVTPLYLSRKTPGATLRSLIPLYVDYETDRFGLKVGLPLYARYETEGSSLTALLPVYFHSHDDALDAEFTYYFPLYGSYRRGATVSRHYLLFPLYSRQEDQAQQRVGWDVLWPLFRYESSPTSLDLRVLPLLWHSRAADHAWTFAPLYGSMTAAGHDYRWLLPFYFRKTDPGSALTVATPALLPPYYVDWESGDAAQFHVWPFYGRARRSGYEEQSVLWPLFRVGASDDGRERVTQLLLYYSARRGEESSAGVLPFWYHASAPDETLDASLFLHWYEHRPLESRTRWSFLWLAPPDWSLVRYEGAPDLVRHGVFPLYTWRRDTARDALDWSFLWPLFSYESEGEFARTTEFLWKAVTYERTAETREFRFLWRFVHGRQGPRDALFEFNPFFYSEREEDTGDYWNVLGGLYGRRTAPDGTVDVQWLWFF